MATAPSHSRFGDRFAVRRLEELLLPPARRDWDARFVAAVLLIYGLTGASFYLVDWLNDLPADAPAAWEVNRPTNAASDADRVPYPVRLPQLLKDQAAGDTSREPR